MGGVGDNIRRGSEDGHILKTKERLQQTKVRMKGRLTMRMELRWRWLCLLSWRAGSNQGSGSGGRAHQR